MLIQRVSMEQWQYSCDLCFPEEKVYVESTYYYYYKSMGSILQVMIESRA